VHILGPLKALFDGLGEELGRPGAEGVGQCICISFIQLKPPQYHIEGEVKGNEKVFYKESSRRSLYTSLKE